MTNISQYFDWANTRDINKLSQSFGFKNATFSSMISEDKLGEYKNDIDCINIIKESMESIRHLNRYLIEDESITLSSLIETLKLNAVNAYKNEWISIKFLYLEKKTIQVMKNLCTTKSGVHPLPMSTGLLDTYESCREIKESSEIILKHLNEKPIEIRKAIGEIQGKGYVYQKKKITCNPDALTHAILPPACTAKISDMRNFKHNLQVINTNAYSDKKGNMLQNVLSFMSDNNIFSLRDLVTVKGELVSETGDKYDPSSGEKSMLMLANSLMNEDKNIYFLDEPELSVGHDYINSVIVPRIIDLAKQGKKVIVCTHDANIAVRTMPLLSVYREYKGNSKYCTYVGSAFMDTLANIDNSDDKYTWTSKCLETLEGGENAFVERSEIYG